MKESRNFVYQRKSKEKSIRIQKWTNNNIETHARSLGCDQRRTGKCLCKCNMIVDTYRFRCFLIISQRRFRFSQQPFRSSFTCPILRPTKINRTNINIKVHIQLLIVTLQRNCHVTKERMVNLNYSLPEVCNASRSNFKGIAKSEHVLIDIDKVRHFIIISCI